MKFNQFKTTCVGRDCKIVKSEMYCPEENHPIYPKGWVDNSNKHKYLNIPRKIAKIAQNDIVFEFEGNQSHCQLSSAKEFQATEKGFIIEHTENWGARLTYEFI